MTYAGIDVGKKTLDLALLRSASGEVRLHRFRNSEQGRSALLNLLNLLLAAGHPHRSVVVVLEASGVYHLPLLQRLVAAGIPVAQVNPYQVAAFRKASGARNKTDTQDALLLAKYALAYRKGWFTTSPRPR